MVLEFVKSGKHQDFLAAVHNACKHLDDLLKIDHPESAESDDLAAAITWPEALRHHLERDAQTLVAWHEEVSKLIARLPLAKAELDRLDPLDSSTLSSLLNRAETSLMSALQNYPAVIQFQKEGLERSPSFKGYVESMHSNLAEARHYISKMEDVIARLATKQEVEDIRRPADQHSKIGPLTKQSIQDSMSSHSKTVSQNDLSFEVSSFMKKQLDHGEVPQHDLQIALHKVSNFVSNGNTPSVPWHGEPHCYGGAPYHLNGIVIGRQERMIYYFDEQARSIRLCAWISDSEHKDAFSRLRHQNMYRRIITSDRSIKLTRNDFDGFVGL